MSVFGSYRVPRIPFDWYALRDAYCDSVHEPMPVTDFRNGVLCEGPFTMDEAIAWAEVLARRELGDG